MRFSLAIYDCQSNFSLLVLLLLLLSSSTEWVSCVRFSPMTTNPIIVSAGWDKVVKVFNLTNCKLKNNLCGHTGYINTVTVSPDGSLCASGGKVGGRYSCIGAAGLCFP